MFKQIYNSPFTLVLLLFCCSVLNAQYSDLIDKDLFKDPVLIEKIPTGKNIPTPYNGQLFILYDNGPIITHPGGGNGGNDASAVQTILSLNTYGFGAQISTGNSLAEDFTIPDFAWRIAGFQFFTYQTGSTTTSTITELQVQIYDGRPDSGGTVIWGDLATNRLTSTEWLNIYRVLDYNLQDSLRPIMSAEMEIMPPLVLPAGTYWIEFRLGGTLNVGPWVPPISIIGQTSTGNAIQKTITGWAAALDGFDQQGFPFFILGNCAIPCPVEEPNNPNPADSAINVLVNGSNVSWTNGAGTTQVELWFGEMGSLSKVYSGTPITSFALPNLNYQTTYEWFVIDKNDTCGTQGPTWAFTTIQVPNLIYSEDPDVPTNAIFALDQNYPNPFNPSTRISWQSPESGWQTLKVFDVLGNEVATLVNEYKTAGSYEVEFNASSMPSGLYFYRIKAGSFVETKKMLLLK